MSTVHMSQFGSTLTDRADGKKTFQEMHDSFSGGMREQLVFDPDNVEVLYLQAIASSHGGEGSHSVAQSLTGDESMKDIIRIALDLENKSILYYVGVREIVKVPHEKDKIDTIIGEERKHVAQLTKVLNETI